MSRHGSLALAALVTLATIIPVPTATAADTLHSSGEVTKLACTDSLFLDVRGSGDPGKEGNVLPAFREAIAPHLPGRVTSMYLDYPAVSTHAVSQRDLEKFLLEDDWHSSPFFASVEAGAKELTRVLTHVRTACPREKVVLVGFSQGAEVITSALTDEKLTATVSASLLLGNPSHYPGQHVRERDAQVSTKAVGMQSLLDYLRARQAATGTTERAAKMKLLISDVFELYEGRVDNAAIASMMRGTSSALPPSAYAKTFSVCAGGDVVCDFAPGMSRLLASSSTIGNEIDQARPIHGGYTPAEAARTIDTLLSTVDPSRPMQQVETATLPVEGPSATPSASTDPDAEAAASPVGISTRGGPGWPATLATGLGALALGLAIGRASGRRR